jgi:hypothetical protein
MENYGYKTEHAPPIPTELSPLMEKFQSELVEATYSGGSDNTLKQSDTGQSIFDSWFDRAKQYASKESSSSATSNVHAEMRRMTRDALQCLVGVGASTSKKNQPFLCSKNLDPYAARSLLEHATQIIVLHSTKPKFKSLLLSGTTDSDLHEPTSRILLMWIQNVFCQELTRVVCYQSVLDSIRSQAIETLKTAQELGECLMLDSQRQAHFPILLDPQPFMKLAVQSNVDVSVRGTAGELITTICRCVGIYEELPTSTHSPSSGTKYSDNDTNSDSLAKSKSIRWQLTETIAQRGMDDKAFTLGWRLGLLDNSKGINILIARIDAEAKRHTSTSSNESMSLSGNSRPLVSAVLRSIYEISMNWRNADVKDLGNEGKFGGGSSSQNGDFVFTNEKHSASMANILRACDVAAKSLYQEKESVYSAEERSQEFLEALAALLETYPDSGALLKLILHPLTLEGLSTVAGLSDRFSIDTWCEWLLPFVRKQLDGMSLRGISGRQIEQEVVDLLRDCARHFYLNDGRDHQHQANLAFGKQLYYCVVEAIRHGYIETEGFSRVAAVVIARHLSGGGGNGGNGGDIDGSGGNHNRNKNYGSKVDAGNTIDSNSVLGWIRYTLSDHVCHSHKTDRAIHEIFLTLLGLESSSGIGYDFDHSGGFGGPSSRTQSEQENLVLSVTTCGTTLDSIASLSLWSELCTSYPVFVEQHELVVTQLLLTIRDDLDLAVKRRGCSVDWWAAAMRMLCVLSGCVTPFNAPLLFDQVLKIMALCPAGEAGSLAANCGDSTVASIVEKIQVPGTQTTVTQTATVNGTSKGVEVEVSTTASPISFPAVLECTRRAGVLTRVALSRIVPEMFLLDTDGRVRVKALQAMQNKSNNDILQATGIIFGACTQVKGKHVKYEHDGSHSLNMHDLDIGLACAPLVGRLAVLDKTGACVILAVERLLWAARLSKEGSHLGQVDQNIIDSLSMIALELESDQLIRFCTSKEGHKWLSRLTTLSTAWEHVVGSLVRDGKLIKSGRSSSNSSSLKKRRGSEHKEADLMYGPEGTHRFEVPEGNFAKALPICTVITVEDDGEKNRIGSDVESYMNANDGPKLNSKSELGVRNGISVNISKMTHPQAVAVVLEGEVIKQNDLKEEQHNSQAYVHLANDQVSLRNELEHAVKARPEGRWAGLNAARQEGRWDWSRSNESVMPVANGFEVASSHISSSSMNAFDFSRLPEAPTHTPTFQNGSSSKSDKKELNEPLLA